MSNLVPSCVLAVPVRPSRSSEMLVWFDLLTAVISFAV